MTVTGCNCSMCERSRRERGVNLAKPARLGDILAEAVASKPLPVREPEMRVPRGLAALRKTVTDFYKSPEKFLDFSTIRARGGGDYIVSGRSFEDVTGLTRLGSGAYSEVFQIDETRVLKIVKSEDSGYARFVRMVQNNPRNPHFPKIYYQGTWGGKTVYILEKLEDYSAADIRDRYYDNVNEYFRDAIRSGGSTNPFYKLATPALTEAATLLSGMINDLHSGNVMFRVNADGSRTPVVTDPATD